ncbi:potassium channel protein [Haloprofundus marisrubri]|uniref:Potassium channel protein n=1 Tax=Haloprofundus marisrubri TaxID=1514971 RepID=A0A0W1R7X3_9EURY|nr:NAD-binding protein [Haloprofundus marisrubri]KTG09223.1 potassium channel protein [Haloprofundus marisrubri]
MEVNRERLGARLAVALTFAAATLSVVTGVAGFGILGLDVPSVDGPLAAYVPPFVQQAAAFTGAFTGFLLLASVYALRNGLRIGWYTAVLLLPLSAAQGLLQSSPLAYPLVVLSILALPVVLLNRRHFEESAELSTTQQAALAAIALAQLYGTVGTYALRDEFGTVDTVVDAFYFTLVTASTVGYGDVTPASQAGKLFAMSVLLTGTASFAVALGTLLTPAIEARFARTLGRMTDTQLSLLEDHVLVLGYGELTEPILEELRDEAEYLVVTRDSARAQELTERGDHVLTADPSDDEPQKRARIEEARAVVAATNDDAQDALAILTARQLNPDVPIVAAATQRGNVQKLKRAGANTVISPAALGGHLLAASALGGQGIEDVAERLLHDRSIER